MDSGRKQRKIRPKNQMGSVKLQGTGTADKGDNPGGF